MEDAVPHLAELVLRNRSRAHPDLQLLRFWTGAQRWFPELVGLMSAFQHPPRMLEYAEYPAMCAHSVRIQCRAAQLL